MLYRILNFHHFETTVIFLKFIKGNSYHGVKLVERRIRNSNSYNTELHTLEQNFWYLNSDLYQALCFGNLENQIRVLLTTGDYMMLVEAVNGIHTHTHTHQPPSIHQLFQNYRKKIEDMSFYLNLYCWVESRIHQILLGYTELIFFFFFLNTQHVQCEVSPYHRLLRRGSSFMEIS